MESQVIPTTQEIFGQVLRVKLGKKPVYPLLRHTLGQFDALDLSFNNGQSMVSKFEFQMILKRFSRFEDFDKLHYNLQNGNYEQFVQFAERSRDHQRFRLKSLSG